MKINEMRGNTVLFGDLRQGNAFFCKTPNGDFFYMVMEPSINVYTKNDFNAIRLDDGSCWHFEKNSEVIRVEAELTVKYL